MTTTTASAPAPGSNYTFWYGGYKVQDLRWLVRAMSDLANDAWDPKTPVYFDGSRWYGGKNAPVREQAAISLLRALERNTTARTLVLRNADLDFKAQLAVKEVFAHNTSLCKVSLQNVRDATKHVANTRGGAAATTSSLALPVPIELFQNTNLQEIHLSQCALDRAGCAALGELVRRRDGRLHTLTLAHVTFVDDGAETCAGSDGHRRRRRTDIAAPLVAALARSTALRHFALVGTHLGSSSYASAGPVVDNNSNNNNNNAVLSKLLRAMGRNTSVTTLHLEQMGLGSTNHNDIANDIAGMLQRNRHLQQLSLRKNDLNGSDIGILLERGVSPNRTLETLLLDMNPIGDDGAYRIARCLRSHTNTSLRTLDLTLCEIWYDGCRAIAQGIGSFRYTGLQHLILDRNDDIEECAPELAESLQRNARIETISRYGLSRQMQQEAFAKEHGGSSPAGTGPENYWAQVDLYLRMNRAKRRYILHEDKYHITSGMVPYVLCDGNSNETAAAPAAAAAAVHQPDVLFQLLREAPIHILGDGRSPGAATTTAAVPGHTVQETNKQLDTTPLDDRSSTTTENGDVLVATCA